jgi:hypothetical protein
LITVSSLAGRALTLTESHDSAEEYSVSQLSFNHKIPLRVAATPRLSCHLADAKMPLLHHRQRHVVGLLTALINCS